MSLSDMIKALGTGASFPNSSISGKAGRRLQICSLLVTLIAWCFVSIIGAKGAIVQYRLGISLGDANTITYSTETMTPNETSGNGKSDGDEMAKARKTVLRDVHPIGFEHLFWTGRDKICRLIENITGVAELGDEPNHITLNQPAPIINLTLDCETLKEHTGNWITAIYHIRLAAALGRVDFHFQCSSGMNLIEKSMLPWMSGTYPAPSNSTWPYDLGWPDSTLVCSREYRKIPLHHLARQIQIDMRSIAVAILGPRHFDTTGLNLQSRFHSIPNRFLAQEDVQIDDAAIHFRCGDVFGLTNKNVYGLVKFREYVQRIPSATTRSIGIHTQPFDVSLLREVDRGAADDCRQVVGMLVEYLHHTYPNATITVRNTKNDTIPLTYARMVMSAQTITSMSTFGIFPAIGSFGQGYYQKSGRQNRFATEIPKILQNFHEMDGPIMSSPDIRNAGWEKIIRFLTE